MLCSLYEETKTQLAPSFFTIRKEPEIVNKPANCCRVKNGLSLLCVYNTNLLVSFRFCVQARHGLARSDNRKRKCHVSRVDAQKPKTNRYTSLFAPAHVRHSKKTSVDCKPKKRCKRLQDEEKNRGVKFWNI